MTESEALEILNLSSTATKEEQQSAFYNLRAGLSEQVKNAPTPMLRERFTGRLSKVYEAQRLLGLKFSEENPDGRDPLFGDTSERAVENNLPTTDDGKNNLPAREKTFEETVLETETDKKESKELDSASDKISESDTTEKNEEKFREALTMSFNTDKFQESDLANPWVRLGAYMIDVVLLFVTLFIGWIIWAFILLGRAQTPGHQLLKLRYIDLSTGKKATFGKMVLMIILEIGLSIILAPFSAGVTNLLWIGSLATMFFTTYRQQATDMMVNVTVVKDPDGIFAGD